MENSPLRFLDYDVSKKLTKDLRIVKEDYARKFHEKNFQELFDENSENHYLISFIITDIRENYPFIYPISCSTWIPFLEITDPSDNLKLYDKFSWLPLSVEEKKKIYNDSVKVYEKNTKLQRCGYNYD